MFNAVMVYIHSAAAFNYSAILLRLQNFTALIVSPAFKPPPARIPFALTSDCVPRSPASAAFDASSSGSNAPVITMTAGDTCTVTVTRTDVSPSARDGAAAAATDQLQSHPAHDHLWARLRGPSIIYVDLNEVDGSPGSWTAEVRDWLRCRCLFRRKCGRRSRHLKRDTTRWMCCGCFPTAQGCLWVASATTTISSTRISQAPLSRW